MGEACGYRLSFRDLMGVEDRLKLCRASKGTGEVKIQAIKRSDRVSWIFLSRKS